MTLTEQLEELMDFDDARILRVRQPDSDLHIATYQVGGEYWMTLIDSRGEKDYDTVYITRDGLDALFETLGTMAEKQIPRL